ncbi:hypothetical protein F0L68_39040 [Solihabitans fulvus]|uniref:Phospholipase C n=1 Tax=Solihabitans fulvus TaxID=1892852 RepID=A0A5B2WHL4_9PSEU|nr:hypothetical protein [Solihabitans fulvus]KAA2250142.1 hypothetical protein F0L68_39040 [Solihabitans fulvus]
MSRRRVLSLAVALGLTASLAGLTSAVATASPNKTKATNAQAGCNLDNAENGIKHVVYLTFDNVHFSRDNPNVPSDLEQMPHLLNFIKENGTLDNNHHTPLIAHTGGDIISTLTGTYGDRNGMPVSNSFRYFNPNGTSSQAISFAYWTDGLFDPANPTPTDTRPTMVTPQGKVAPAPWVPFTRAGCDFGAVGTANTVLENTGPDVPKVFGANSPEVAEAKADPGLASTDFVGIGVHCAKDSTHCKAGHAQPDLLPDEPGGYQNFPGLFGAKYVNPVISPAGPVTAVDGKTPITDDKGRPGFPGFDGMSAANTLGYMASMQEAGIPVTYGYISDAHDRHPTGGAYGPGEAGYVKALKDYDDAFASFFQRLTHDGINADNTAFVITSDENDHFVGGAPSPANCDGVHTPCTYQQLGEINANARGLLSTQQNVTTPFQVHADSAPNFYLDGNPAPGAQVTRDFEHAVSKLTAVNPITGKTDKIQSYVADPTEMKLLHMVTGDPARTPTFTTFADPNYYVFAGQPNCGQPCVALGPGFAWNHGDFAPDINRTWLGLVAPGVRNLGVTDKVWSDHTDIRPTLLALLGLRDSYTGDGRALFELVESEALPDALNDHRRSLTQLAATFKQLNACVGEFGSTTLAASTKALESETPGDKQYTDTMKKLTDLGTKRDALVARIQPVLDRAVTDYDAEFTERQISKLNREGQDLLKQAKHV